ncbi:hypothetical protein MBRA_06261 [Methylobacterium brachiatum]|nr:hypothetical protein MBRA_06261 [Methylobacterium brachiatum]
MPDGLIDLWNPETFDDALLAELRCEAGMILDYFATERANHEAYCVPGNREMLRENPHGHIYNLFVDKVLTPLMAARTVRGWHYTRMTDAEVELLRRDGVYPSSLATIRRRLDSLAALGVITLETADVLFAESPFHSDEMGGRGGKFWTVSQPLPVTWSDVTSLLGSWGGESIYWRIQDPELVASIARIGRPRVLEIALPLDAGPDARAAARAVTRTFAAGLGCMVTRERLDLHVVRLLGPEAVVAVHTEGDESYAQIGRQYPPGFVADVD